MTTAKPVALVTGASSGIGKATALALVDAGFEVGTAPLRPPSVFDRQIRKLNRLPA